MCMPACGCTGPGEAPGNVRAEAVSSTEISIQWNGLSTCRLVNGLIIKYEIRFQTCYVTETRDRELRDGEDWSSGGNILLTGLTPLTNYSIEVAAVNKNGDIGPSSDPITTVTQESKSARHSNNIIIVYSFPIQIAVVLNQSVLTHLVQLV